MTMREQVLKRLSFTYENHRGEEHDYVVDFDRGYNPGIFFDEEESELVLSGELVSRDGDLREDLETRRRSFIVRNMKEFDGA